MPKTEVWIYEGRNDQAAAYWNYQDARDQQDRDNRRSAEECKADGYDVGGSEEDGYFYIDDGGSIHKVTVQ